MRICASRLQIIAFSAFTLPWRTFNRMIIILAQDINDIRCKFTYRNIWQCALKLLRIHLHLRLYLMVNY